MRVGFTGTKFGMTSRQKDELYDWLAIIDAGRVAACTLHHGGCVGADAQAHAFAVERGWSVIVHPGDVAPRWRAELEEGRAAGQVETRTIMPPLERNDVIVDLCDVLLVAPRQRKEIQRSGTWATYRYAQKVGRTCIMVWP